MKPPQQLCDSFRHVLEIHYGGKTKECEVANVDDVLAIAAEAGATLRRLDTRSYSETPVPIGAPFDIYSRSCVCACSAVLADSVVGALKPPSDLPVDASVVDRT